jgi:hypothetical protein
MTCLLDKNFDAQLLIFPGDVKFLTGKNRVQILQVALAISKSNEKYQD